MRRAPLGTMRRAPLGAMRGTDLAGIYLAALVIHTWVVLRVPSMLSVLHVLGVLIVMLSALSALRAGYGLVQLANGEGLVVLRAGYGLMVWVWRAGRLGHRPVPAQVATGVVV